MTDPAAHRPLPPGSTIGILGGGQLGRMLAMAAARLGLHAHVFDPAADAPAGHVARAHTVAAYEDRDALLAFAGAVDVVTYEFENIPTSALDTIEAQVPIRPGRQALAVSQDRLSEKIWLEGIGLSVAPYADVTPDTVDAALGNPGLPGILKTRRFGYDGKGQLRLNPGDDLATAVAGLAGAPAVLEGFVDFTSEVSVIGARSLDGAVACFDPGQNVHKSGILHTTTVPADLPRSLATDAVLICGRILSALDYVGVMGVELFVTPRGLVVNEIAPRVHNSGHWTEAACTIDQFEQHIRAISGWPLGDGSRHSDAQMLNLIGDDVDGWADHADAMLHLYGKAEARPGRKMGHVTRLSPRA